MRILVPPLSVLALWLAGCSTAPAPPAPEPAARGMSDETHHFPVEGRLETKLVESDLYGRKSLGPGYTAKYKQGKLAYELFLAHMPVTGAALALFDFKKSLAGAKLIPHFGGYYGQDGGVPTFAFAKGEWIAGVRGLSEKDADTVARDFAARLN